MEINIPVKDKKIRPERFKAVLVLLYLCLHDIKVLVFLYLRWEGEFRLVQWMNLSLYNRTDEDTWLATFLNKTTA